MPANRQEMLATPSKTSDDGSGTAVVLKTNGSIDTYCESIVASCVTWPVKSSVPHGEKAVVVHALWKIAQLGIVAGSKSAVEIVANAVKRVVDRSSRRRPLHVVERDEDAVGARSWSTATKG